MPEFETTEEKPVKKVIFFDGNPGFKLLFDILMTEIDSIEAQIKKEKDVEKRNQLEQKKQALEARLNAYEKFVENPSGKDKLLLGSPFNAALIYYTQEEDLLHGESSNEEVNTTDKSDLSFVAIHSYNPKNNSSSDKKILRSIIKSGGKDKVIASDVLLEKLIRQTRDGGTVVFSTCYGGAMVQNIPPELVTEIQKRKIKVIIAGDSENRLFITSSAVGKIHAELIKNDTGEPEKIVSQHFAETFQFFNHTTQRWEKRGAIELVPDTEEAPSFFRQKSYFDSETGEWKDDDIEDVTANVKDASTGLANHLLHLPEAKIHKKYDKAKTLSLLRALYPLYKDNVGLPRVSRYLTFDNILRYAIDGMYSPAPPYLAEAVIAVFDEEQLRHAIYSPDPEAITLFLSIVALFQNGKKEIYETITKQLESKFKCENWMQIAEEEVEARVLALLFLDDDYPPETILILDQIGFFKDIPSEEIKNFIDELDEIDEEKTRYHDLKTAMIKLYYNKVQGIEALKDYLNTIDPIENHPIAKAITSFDDTKKFKVFMDTLREYIAEQFPGESLSSLISEKSIAEIHKFAEEHKKSSLLKDIKEFVDIVQKQSQEQVLPQPTGGAVNLQELFSTPQNKTEAAPKTERTGVSPGNTTSGSRHSRKSMQNA